MGMYTDLVCTAIIKEKYRDRIHKKVFCDEFWRDLFTEKWAYDFVENNRADFIPYSENDLTNEEIFDGIKLHIECSLKNYEETYEDFFKFLKKISDEIIEFKTLYEDNYEYANGVYTFSWYNYLTNEYEDEEKIFT